MRTLRVNDVLKDKILVSRESAHLLEDALNAMMAAARTPGNPSGATSMAVDFEGIEGITPSFVDELLSIFESMHWVGSHRFGAVLGRSESSNSALAEV